MNAESSTPFLDEYCAECEEHLDSIYRHLIVLESCVDRDVIDAGVVDELLRAFHSVKGLSAMASIAEVEEAAHAMEDILRSLEQTGAGPTWNVMEALAIGASAIKDVVTALRDRRTPEVGAPVRHRSAPPHGHWLFRFNPSSELSARGINIASVRSRLESIGQILNTTPRIVEGGHVTFDFTVASDAEEDEVLGWRSDGLTAARVLTPAAPEVSEGVSAVSTPSVVRVDMKRLDDLMTILGDLVIDRGRVEESLRQFEKVLPVSEWRSFQDANLLLQRHLRDLRESVMRLRMAPVGEIFERMRYAIRGLQRESRKTIRLEASGQNTEIDKLLVERMMDPVLHMVRNAASHGLEPPSERIAAGKTVEGRLHLRASTEGDTVVIELEDDGRGVDVEGVTLRAQAMKLIGSGEPLDGSRLLQIMCTPGFSTRHEADFGAGRGIGMAVVKTTVDGLGGTLAMDTRTGKGTRFIIRLPLTLAIMPALIVHIDDRCFAVPRSAIHEVLRVETSTLSLRENREVVSFRDGALPIVYLRRLFGMSGESSPVIHVLVVGSDRGPLGIAVDRISGQREIVVRPLEDSLIRMPGIAGATELGDGRPVLIVNVAAIVETAREATERVQTSATANASSRGA